MTEINEEWLRETGFRWEQGERQPTKHWLLWIADACIDPVEPDRRMWSAPEDLGIEIACDDRGRFWYCWLRADHAGRYSRLLHVRHITERHEVVRIIEALTGRTFISSDVLYGSLRPPEVAQRMRDEAARLDRRIAQSQMESHDRTTGHDPSRRGILG